MTENYRKTKSVCYSGYVVQAIINNFLPILFIVFRKSYGIGYEQLGRLVLVNFAVQIGADVVTPFVTRKIGYRFTAVMSQAVAAVGLLLIAVLPKVMTPYSAIMCSIVVYAFGSGMMEVILSPLVELLPSGNKGANMAFLHSFYCWGQAFTVLGTTAMVFLFGYGGWQYIPLIWAIIPICNALLFMRVPIVEPKPETEQKPAKDIFKRREIVFFAVFMSCAGCSEIAMAQWASVFAQQGLGVNKVIGDLLGPCAFAIFMGTGRIIYGAFSGRYSVRKALIINNILCLLCYLTVGLTHQPFLSLIACALCGFSVSLSWPGTLSMAAAAFPDGGTVMFGFFAFCGDLGCSVGPWLVGLLADRIGLQNGFLFCAMFPLIMIITSILLPRHFDT